MSQLLLDKTAVITGAASGNGRAIAKEFAREGANIVVADLQRDPREGGTPTDEFVETETDAQVTFVECDVTRIADLQNAIEEAEELGGLDIMVNNAGIYRYDDVLEVTEEEYNTMMDVNVKGVFFGAQVAAEKMVERGEGKILNISSTAGIAGSRSSSLYSASKGAVRLLTYGLATELGPDGVHVNAIHPGVIETSMTKEDVPLISGDREDHYANQIPLKRFGKPNDVADAAVFLAGDGSDYVTGASLVVDGGMVNSG